MHLAFYNVEISTYNDNLRKGFQVCIQVGIAMVIMVMPLIWNTPGKQKKSLWSNHSFWIGVYWNAKLPIIIFSMSDFLKIYYLDNDIIKKKKCFEVETFLHGKIHISSIASRSGMEGWIEKLLPEPVAWLNNFWG